MGQVESTEGSPAKSYHTGIESKSAIMRDQGEINDFHAVLNGAPAPFAAFEFLPVAGAAGQPKISGENGDFMTALDQAPRERADFDDGAALFLERIVGLYDFQDAH